MSQPAFSSGPRSVLGVAAIGALLLSFAGCNAKSDDDEAASDPTSTTALPSGWRRLSQPEQKLYSPRWAPSGDKLLAAGYQGVGLHVIDRKHARVVRTFAGLRGDARFLDADRICHGMLDKGKTLRLDNSTGDGVPCEVASSDEPRGRLVFNGLRTAVFHDAFRGTVTLLQTGGAEKVVEDQGAWGVAVSSDGRGVAWSLGALAQPELVVYDPTHGRTPVGPGAQPSWLPDGRHFVYARPTSLPPGLQEAYESDLYLYDVVKQKSSRLTDTPTIAEMEPAVSPDGREVAFSDWRTGELLVAPLPGAVASKGGTP